MRFDSGIPVSHHTKSQSHPRFCPRTAWHLLADAQSFVATLNVGQSLEQDLTRRRGRPPSGRGVLVPGRAATVRQSSASRMKFPLRSVSWRIAARWPQWHHPDWPHLQSSPETAARGCSGWRSAEQEYPAESGTAAVRVRHAGRDRRKFRTESANPPRVEQPRRLPGGCWFPIRWTRLSLKNCLDCACVAESSVQSETQAEPSERLRNCQKASARSQGRQLLIWGANSGSIAVCLLEGFDRIRRLSARTTSAEYRPCWPLARLALLLPSVTAMLGRHPAGKAQ